MTRDMTARPVAEELPQTYDKSGSPDGDEGTDMDSCTPSEASSVAETAVALFLGRLPGQLPFRRRQVIRGAPRSDVGLESRAALARRWGRPVQTVGRLAQMGLLPVVPHPSAGPSGYVDAACWPTAEDFFAEWEAQLPLLDSFADFDTYEDVKRLCGREGMFSRFQLDCMFDFLGDMGGFSQAELMTVASMPSAGSPVANRPGAMSIGDVIKALRETNGRRRRESRVVDKDLAVSIEDVRALLPEGLRHLPRTELDPDFGDDYAGLSIDFIRRLLAIRSAPIRTVAAVWLLIQRAQRPLGDPWRYIAFAETLDDLFEELDVLDPAVAGRQLWAYIGERSIEVSDAKWAVLGVARFWSGHRTVLEGYANNNASVADAVHAILLPLPEERLLHVMRRLRCEANRGEREDRIRHALPLARRLPAVLAAMRNRARQARRMARECRRATAKRVELGEVDASGRPAPFPFSYDEDVIGPDGQRLPGRQTVFMVAWPDETAVAILDETRRLTAWDGRYGDEPRDMHEFVAVAPCDAGVEAHEAWFVEFFRNGAFSAGARLAAPVRERRRRLMIDGGIDCPQFRPPDLVTGNDREGQIMLLSLTYLGRVFIPAEAFAHGMVFACVLGGVIAKSLSRFSEAMQVRKEDSGWTAKLVRGEWRVAFLAVPKGRSDERPFRVDRRVLTELRWLRLITQERDGLDDLPVVAQSRARTAAKCGPARYVFAFRGRMLRNYHLLFLIRVLTAGLGRCLPHDLRHAGARWARWNGGTKSGVGRRLGHSAESGSTDYYSGLLDEMWNEGEDEDVASGDADDLDDDATHEAMGTEEALAGAFEDEYR